MRRLLPVTCAAALACGSSTPPRKLVLLHTNDEHSHLLGFGPESDDFAQIYLSAGGSGGGIQGGVSRRGAVLAGEREAARAAGADTLTVSAGDNMMGTLMQVAAATAAPDYRVMKMLGYDVTTLGNHEFDYGPAALAASIAAAQGSAQGMPRIVASNIRFSGTQGDAALAALFDESGRDTAKRLHRKLVIVTPNGLRVGFVGVMGADAAAVAPLKAPTRFSIAQGTREDDRIASLAQIYDDLQPSVDSLRGELNVDLVVALSHSGADVANPDGSEDFGIARNVSGIDVIVSGHTHTEVPATLISNARGRTVLVQQAGRFGDTVGRISLSVDAKGAVAFDTQASALLKVDGSKPASDAAINSFVGGVIQALEQQPLAPGQPSFLAFTLGEILQSAPPAPSGTGTLYNYALAGLDFAVDNASRFQETPLLDLVADAQLAAANEGGIGPTELAVEGAGAIRVSKLEIATRAPFAGKLAFGDVFRTVPLGASPASGTPGYPLCRFGIWLAEIKAAFEVSAGFAYAGHDDLYIVPAGFKFEYDTTRPAFNPGGNPLDRNNGRVTRIWQLKPAALAAGNYDGDYDLKFDASRTTPIAPGVPPGWLDDPTRIVSAASSLYIATFATFAGVHLKDPATGAPIPGNDATATIVKRADGTEIKEWEALGRYVNVQSNGGNLPARYGRSGGTFPRRALCVGANSSNPAGGNCSH